MCLEGRIELIQPRHDYEGELDENGLAFGFGQQTEKYFQDNYRGTFVGSKWEGIGMIQMFNSFMQFFRL